MRCCQSRVDLKAMAVRGTPHSPKLHNWSLAIRLFNVIFRTLVDEVLLLCRDAVGIFFGPSQLDLNVNVVELIRLCA